MVDVAGIPLWVRLRSEEPSFIKVEGEWMVVGKIEDLPCGHRSMIRRRTNGDEVEVLVTEHVMGRRVRHRGDSTVTEYVIARFE
jgi:hypothetical protein